MDEKNNDLATQPKNTPILPLAGEIPQYRQAKLAGRKFLGPIVNVAPIWREVTALTSINNRGFAQPQPPIIYPKSVKLGVGEPIAEEIAQLELKLSQKEQELNLIEEKTLTQKQQLGELSTREKASLAVIQNLKQQILNMNQNNIDQQEIIKLQETLAMKEKENEQLKTEIDSLKSALSLEDKLKNQIVNYRQHILELTQQQEKLKVLVAQEEQKLKDLEQKLAEKAQTTENKQQQMQKLERLLEEAVKASISAPQASITQVIQAAQLQTPNKIPVLTQAPNAINGIVRDAKGKLIPDAVVIIKDKANRNLRALKTNQLGQFVVTTSLPNGQYFIQLEKKDLSFNVISIVLSGGNVPPIEIISHETTT